jgi:hypothetical protein
MTHVTSTVTGTLVAVESGATRWKELRRYDRQGRGLQVLAVSVDGFITGATRGIR